MRITVLCHKWCGENVDITDHSHVHTIMFPSRESWSGSRTFQVLNVLLVHFTSGRSNHVCVIKTETISTVQRSW